MSNKLAHSGIKGMRWGVRKEYTKKADLQLNLV